MGFVMQRCYEQVHRLVLVGKPAMLPHQHRNPFEPRLRVLRAASMPDNSTAEIWTPRPFLDGVLICVFLAARWACLDLEIDHTVDLDGVGWAALAGAHGLGHPSKVEATPAWKLEPEPAASV